jgi:hypothetical protein
MLCIDIMNSEKPIDKKKVVYIAGIAALFLLGGVILYSLKKQIAPIITVDKKGNIISAKVGDVPAEFPLGVPPGVPTKYLEIDTLNSNIIQRYGTGLFLLCPPLIAFFASRKRADLNFFQQIKNYIDGSYAIGHGVLTGATAVGYATYDTILKGDYQFFGTYAAKVYKLTKEVGLTFAIINANSLIDAYNNLVTYFSRFVGNKLKKMKNIDLPERYKQPKEIKIDEIPKNIGDVIPRDSGLFGENIMGWAKSIISEPVIQKEIIPENIQFTLQPQFRIEEAEVLNKELADTIYLNIVNNIISNNKVVPQNESIFTKSEEGGISNENESPIIDVRTVHIIEDYSKSEKNERKDMQKNLKLLNNTNTTLIITPNDLIKETNPSPINEAIVLSDMQSNMPMSSLSVSSENNNSIESPITYPSPIYETINNPIDQNEMNNFYFRPQDIRFRSELYSPIKITEGEEEGMTESIEEYEKIVDEMTNKIIKLFLKGEIEDIEILIQSYNVTIHNLLKNLKGKYPDTFRQIRYGISEQYNYLIRMYRDNFETFSQYLLQFTQDRYIRNFYSQLANNLSFTYGNRIGKNQRKEIVYLRKIAASEETEFKNIRAAIAFYSGILYKKITGEEPFDKPITQNQINQFNNAIMDNNNPFRLFLDSLATSNDYDFRRLFRENIKKGENK